VVLVRRLVSKYAGDEPWHPGWYRGVRGADVVAGDRVRMIPRINAEAWRAEDHS
jgi:hypothetical protein